MLSKPGAAPPMPPVSDTTEGGVSSNASRLNHYFMTGTLCSPSGDYSAVLDFSPTRIWGTALPERSAVLRFAKIFIQVLDS